MSDVEELISRLWPDYIYTNAGSAANQSDTDIQNQDELSIIVHDDHQYVIHSNTCNQIGDHEYASAPDAQTAGDCNSQEAVFSKNEDKKAFVKKRKPGILTNNESKTTKIDFPSKEAGDSLLKSAFSRPSRSETTHTDDCGIAQTAAVSSGEPRVPVEILDTSNNLNQQYLSIIVSSNELQFDDSNVIKKKEQKLSRESSREVLSPIGNTADVLNEQFRVDRGLETDLTQPSICYESYSGVDCLLAKPDDVSDHMYSMHIPTKENNDTSSLLETPGNASDNADDMNNWTTTECREAPVDTTITIKVDQSSSSSITPIGISSEIGLSVNAGSMPQTPSIAGSMPQTPSIAGSMPQTPSIAGSMPQTPSIAGSMPQTPSIAGSMPQTPSIALDSNVELCVFSSATKQHIKSNDSSNKSSHFLGGQSCDIVSVKTPNIERNHESENQSESILNQRKRKWQSDLNSETLLDSSHIQLGEMPVNPQPNCTVGASYASCIPQTEVRQLARKLQCEVFKPRSDLNSHVRLTNIRRLNLTKRSVIDNVDGFTSGEPKYSFKMPKMVDVSASKESVDNGHVTQMVDGVNIKQSVDGVDIKQTVDVWNSVQYSAIVTKKKNVDIPSQNLDFKTVKKNISVNTLEENVDIKSVNTSSNKMCVSAKNTNTASNPVIDILKRIDSLIDQNQSKLDGRTQNEGGFTNNGFEQKNNFTNVEELRKESIKRIEYLLEQNESISSAKDMDKLQPNKVKVTLGDKIRLVKESISKSQNSDKLSKTQQYETKKSDAIRRIEQLIQQNEKNIQTQVESSSHESDGKSDVTISEDVTVDVVTKSTFERKRAKSFTMGETAEVYSQDQALRDVECMLVTKKAEKDSIHDHAYLRSKLSSTALSKKSKQFHTATDELRLRLKNAKAKKRLHRVSSKTVAHVNKPHVNKPSLSALNLRSAELEKQLEFLKEENNPLLILAQISENESKRRDSQLVDNTLTSHTCDFAKRDFLERMDIQPVESDIRAPENSSSPILETESNSRAMIQDHTYEEDKVNTQQFSILRDHSYKKLRKSKKLKNSLKYDSGRSVDHTYTPKP